jgi:thioredoxin 1
LGVIILQIISLTVDKKVFKHKEFKGKLLVIKINVDNKPDLAAQYQIQSIPTIMMFHNGSPKMRLVGALPYNAIKQEVLENL